MLDRAGLRKRLIRHGFATDLVLAKRAGDESTPGPWALTTHSMRPPRGILAGFANRLFGRRLSG